MSKPPTRLLIALLALLALSTACASSRTIDHEYEMSPGNAFVPTGKEAILLPINETMEVPTGMEAGERTTQELIVEHLQSKGLSVKTLEVREYRSVMQQAANRADRARRAGESSSTSESLTFEEVVPQMVAVLDSDAEIVVIPNMVIRVGRASGGRSIAWDGVRRRQAGSFSDNTGTVSVASLHVAVYDRDGVKTFSGFGGLDILFKINMARRRFELMDDRLQDEDNLREGVCVAFYPLFGTDERC